MVHNSHEGLHTLCQRFTRVENPCLDIIVMARHLFRDGRDAGNVDMVHPSLEVIAKGIPTILKWCAIRKRNSKAAR